MLWYRFCFSPPAYGSHIYPAPGAVPEMKEQSTTKKSFSPQIHVFTDMRFWLIVVMLAAFLGLVILVGPGGH